VITPPQFPSSPLNTPRRRRINELLGRVGPNLQQFYRDGCRLADATVVLEAGSNTVGNCAREIDSAVRGMFRTVLLDPPPDRDGAVPEEYDEDADDGEDQPDEPKAKHKEQILAIVDVLKLPRDSEVTRGWIRIATGRGGGKGKGFAKKTHRRALEAIPPLTDEDTTEWGLFEDLLVVVLPHLETRIVELLPRFRALAELPSPTKADRSELRRLPNTPRTRGEFFAHATPGWFRLLDRGHFFDQPQDAFTYDAVTGAAQPREWQAMSYLARMGAHPEHHERFIAVAERVPIPHEWALRELVLVTRGLPVEIAVRLTKRYAGWIRSHGLFFVADNLADVAAWLGEQGEVEAATELLDALLALDPDPQATAQGPAETDAFSSLSPVTRLRGYEYERVVKRGLIPLARLRPREGFDLALGLLVRALELSTREPRLSEKRDSSPWHRPSLTSEPLHSREDALHVLTNATRDAARLRLTAEGTTLRQVVTALESRGWTLCRRLGLQLILENQDAEMARERLLDPTLIHDGGTWPEFVKLRDLYFGTFSVEDRRTYVTGVESSATDGSDPDFTVGAEREEWIMRRLRSVAPHLEEDVVARHPELAQWVARPQPREGDEEALASGWVAERPGVGTEGLAAMAIDDVVAHLKTWVPPDTFGGPSIEGQAGALQAAVAADPAGYAPNAMAFADLDPTYVRSVLAAFEDVIRNKGAAFDWAPVLRLAAAALSHPPMERRSGMDRDPDWTWTHKAIADLVQHGLEAGPNEIPAELHAEVWPLIDALAGKSSHTGILSDDTEDGPDALTAALNSIRGSALFAAVNYVGRLQRDRTEGAPSGMAAAPATQDLLEYHLDPANDPSLATRGVFGVRLAQLIAIDRAWVEQRRDLFFPPGDERVAVATWEAFIPWNQPSRAVLEIFPDQFAAAIARSDRARSNRRNEPEDKAAEHLMAFYLRGYIGLESPDGLLAAFYRRAPAWLRGHAVEFLGRVQRDSKDLTPEHCERLQALWESRIAAARSTGRDERRAELEQFGWWFASDSCNEEWRLRQLIETLKLTGSIENDSLVLEKLRTVATAQPVEAIEALELMIDEPKDRWLVHVWLEDIVAIITIAVRDEKANESARELAARLVADGYDGNLVALSTTTYGDAVPST
jgi:hypothetical protein